MFPGLFFVLPCTDEFVKVDLRTVSFNIPPQEVCFYFVLCVRICWYLFSQVTNCSVLHLQILTKDSVTVSVDGVVYFRIWCPISSVANVSDGNVSTRLLAQTTLRNVLGTKNLSELLSDREHISMSMQVNKKKYMST